MIEDHPFLGGVAAWSLGMQINQWRPNGGSRSFVHEQFIQSTQAYGDQAIRFGRHEIWTVEAGPTAWICPRWEGNGEGAPAALSSSPELSRRR